jgi:hypothetical protein
VNEEGQAGRGRRPFTRSVSTRATRIDANSNARVENENEDSPSPWPSPPVGAREEIQSAMQSDAVVTEVIQSDAEVTQVGLQINGLRGLRRLGSHAFLRDPRRSRAFDFRFTIADLRFGRPTKMSLVTPLRSRLRPTSARQADASAFVRTLRRDESARQDPPSRRRFGAASLRPACGTTARQARR